MALSTRLFRLHRRVLDTSERGLPLAVLRALLRGASVLYGAGARTRNALYDIGIKRSHRAGVPVISIGNLTAGGTGKTPMVAWLARLLEIHKLRPAILSRGYGRDPGSGVDDENDLLARRAGGAPVVVNPDRVAGARTAVKGHDADVLVMDDGFQHRRLARDLDVVLIDAVWPFGGGHLLPRGLLREPLKAANRADYFVITRCNLVDADRLEGIEQRLRELNPDAPAARCRIAAHSLVPVSGGPDVPVQRLAEGRWGAFCGIGNPEGFRRTLARAGCEPAFFRVFPDHKPYGRQDVDMLLAEAQAAGCDALVTTEKDVVKVAPLLAQASDRAAIYALRIDLDFARGSAAFTAAVLDAVGLRP